MTPKQETLLKDLATLFAKYRLSDWVSVFEALQASPAVFEQLMDLVGKIDAKKVSAKKTTPWKSNSVSRATTRQSEAVKLTAKQEMLREKLETKLRTLDTPNKASIYRLLFEKTGSKMKAPSSNDELIYHLSALLSELSPRDLQKFFETADVERADMHQDYQRWIKIISGAYAKGKQ